MLFSLLINKKILKILFISKFIMKLIKCKLLEKKILIKKLIIEKIIK